MAAPTVVVLVPRRAGVVDRDRLWAFARARWVSLHPDWPIIEGHHDFGPFNRSAAINYAAADAGDWDVAVIIDADVLCDPEAVERAVDAAAETGAMVVAGNRRLHLSRRGTQKVMGGYEGSWATKGFVEATFTKHWSSCVVVSRGLWESVGGFDEMFAGWGYEDDAFRHACETISGHDMIRVEADIWHLWHRRVSDSVTRSANRRRADRYAEAAGDPVAMRALLAESDADVVSVPSGPTRIPRILHRTVPAETSQQVEAWWEQFRRLHPGWEFATYRDPLDPADWPETGDLWDLCPTGAQRAGLIRLEALYKHGGVYVDSDVEPYRSLEPLLGVAAFAGWEDDVCVPDAVLGCEPGHPAFRQMLDQARQVVADGGGPWQSGPGVTTEALPGRPDVLLLPPGSFYPYHYKHKRKGATVDHRAAQPWAFAAHHWHASWVEKK